MRRAAACMSLIALLFAGAAHSAQTQTLSHGRFRNLALLRPAGEVSEVVLLLSSTPSDPAAEEAAIALADRGAVVVVIDAQQFERELLADGADCVYPDGDLENLSRFVQAYLRLPGYHLPMLVGVGASASFVYAMLAQAPADTFAGAISIGFCPTLSLQKRLCSGEGLKLLGDSPGAPVNLSPGSRASAPWRVLQGESDRTCSVAQVRAFMADDQHAKVVALPDVAHDYRRPERWISQLQSAFDELSALSPRPRPAPDELQDLPVVEVRARSAGDAFAVLLSGDGGWAGIDKDLAAWLAARGVAVVGLDSLRYFWTARTPAQTAHDVERIIEHYARQWGRRRVLLIGYSQGADVLPFVINRLGDATRERVQLIALLSPGLAASFEFHLSSWTGGDEGDHPIRPEAQKLNATRTLCIYGEDDEKESLCPQLTPGVMRVQRLPGGHHFNGAYDEVAALILAGAQSTNDAR